MDKMKNTEQRLARMMSSSNNPLNTYRSKATLKSIGDPSSSSPAKYSSPESPRRSNLVVDMSPKNM